MRVVYKAWFYAAGRVVGHASVKKGRSTRVYARYWRARDLVRTVTGFCELIFFFLLVVEYRDRDRPTSTKFSLRPRSHTHTCLSPLLHR